METFTWDDIMQQMKLLSPTRVNNYSDWILVGECLKNCEQICPQCPLLRDVDRDLFFLLWDLWSQQSEKYDPSIMEEQWKSFQGTGSFATLRAMAK